MIYYGYRRGDNDKVVDWASVSSEMSQDLRDIEEGREQERNKIEGEIALAKENINDMPMGNYESMNSFVLNAANSAAENLRVQSALLRSGKLKPSQFSRFRQNILDGIGSYKKVAEGYNTIMNESVQRLQDGAAGELEAYSSGLMQEMANLANTVPVIDPVTGVMINAPKGKDGKPDMKRAMSVLDMQNLAHQKYDRFDMNGQLDPIVDKYGKQIEVLRSEGLIKSDILRKTFGDADKSMDQVIDDTMKQYTDEQLSSVLFDHIQGYKPTEDESLRDSDPEKYILIGRDGRMANRLSPTLTPDQQDKARQAIKEQLLAKLDLVERPYTPPSTGSSSAQQKRTARVKASKENMNLLAKLFKATDTADVNEVLATYKKQLTGSVKQLAGSAKLFKEARVDGNELVIEYDNPEYVEYGEGSKTLEQRVPMPDNFKEFVRTVGPALTGNNDLIELYDEAIVDVEDVDNLTRGTATGAFKITSPMPEFDKFASKIEKVDTWYTNRANRNRAIKKYIKDYNKEFGSDVVSYKVSEDSNSITISAEGVNDQVIDVKWKRDSADVSEDIEEAVRKIHNELRKGTATTGGGGLMSGF
jgi:hypothetical protein